MSLVVILLVNFYAFYARVMSFSNHSVIAKSFFSVCGIITTLYGMISLVIPVLQITVGTNLVDDCPTGIVEEERRFIVVFV